MKHLQQPFVILFFDDINGAEHEFVGGKPPGFSGFGGEIADGQRFRNVVRISVCRDIRFIGRVLMCRGNIGEQIHAAPAGQSFCVVDMQTVDGDVVRHITFIPEIVITGVASLENRCGLGKLLAPVRRPFAVADDEVTVPGGAVVGTEVNHMVAVDLGILHKQGTGADDAQAGMTELTADDRQICNTLMRVNAGEGAISVDGILAEVGAGNTPIAVVVDVDVL